MTQLEQSERNRCIECGLDFPPGELMQFPEFHACAECKPEVVRKLAAGIAVGRYGRVGSTLVLLIESEVLMLPDFCPRCGGDAAGEWISDESAVKNWEERSVPRHRKLTWRYRLCARHRRMHRIANRTALVFLFLGMAAGGAASILGTVDSRWPFAIAVSMTAVCGTIFTRLFVRYPGLGKTKSGYAIFHGCSGAYLAKVPEWQG